MKIVLLFIAPILLLTACDKKYCWNCELRTTTITIANAGDSVLNSDTRQEEVCEKTEREIQIIQNDRTNETVTEDRGVTTRALYMYDCRKQ